MGIIIKIQHLCSHNNNNNYYYNQKNSIRTNQKFYTVHHVDIKAFSINHIDVGTHMRTPSCTNHASSGGTPQSVDEGRVLPTSIQVLPHHQMQIHFLPYDMVRDRSFPVYHDSMHNLQNHIQSYQLLSDLVVINDDDDDDVCCCCCCDDDVVVVMMMNAMN